MTTHGGTTWIRLSATNASSPRSASAARMATTSAGGTGSRVDRSSTRSSAQNTPVPRTSPTRGWRSDRARSPGPRTSAPIRAAFSTMFSSAMASRVATMEAMASGCPE
nr:hypothetical protein DA06_15245 [Georgenia sp. SUBG003]